MFASAGCSHCARAKAFLDARGVPHAVIDLTTHPARLADQRALTGSSSVPQVLFNREVVGGADDLEALEAELGPDGFLERVREALAAPDPTTPRLALDATPPVDADGPVATPTPSRPPMPRHDDDDDDDDEPIVATLNGVRFGFVAMIRELRSIVRVGDSAPRGLMRVVQRRCFTGADLVTALLGKHPSDLGREAAAAFAQRLCDAQVVREVGGSNPGALKIRFRDDPRALYRLQPDNHPGWLNPWRLAWVPRADDALARDDPASLCAALRAEFTRLCDAHADVTNPGAVRYDALRSTPDFERLRVRSCALRSARLDSLGYTTRLAFLINAYNLSVGLAIAAFGAPRTRAHRRTFFDDVRLCVGSYSYSLSEIEHGLLRGNARAPYGLFRPFAASDPRVRFATVRIPRDSGDSKDSSNDSSSALRDGVEVDARIHFALNCGARSCPPVSSYTPTDVDEELEAAAEAFVEGSTFVDVDKRTVTTSAIFRWYARDFGRTDEEVLGRIRGWMPAGRGRSALEGMLADGRGGVRLAYAPYDWTTNASDSTSDYDATATRSEYSWLLGG